jgi:hypothetical protein
MRFHVASIAMFALASAARAGLTVQTKNEGRLQTIATEGNRIRLENVDKKGRTEIFDADKKLLVAIDLKKKTYAEFTETDVRKAGERMRQEMDKMRAEAERQIATLPPEQRKEMEQMLRRGGAGTIADFPEAKYQPTGQKKTIAGIGCQVYRVTREGLYERETCLIPWGSQLKNEDLKVLDSFSDFLSQAFSGKDRPRFKREFEQIMPASGFPAQVVDVAEGKKVIEELVSISRGSVPLDKFKTPAGLTKVSPEEMGIPGLESGREPDSRARPDLGEDKSEENAEDEKN